MATECPNCGGSPMGEGCYHICYNSVHYYSPEQERQDDVHYGEDDHRERYAATAEPSQYADEEYVHHCEFCGRDDTHLEEGCGCANGRALPSMTVGAVLKHKNTDNNDDIPF